ncbi:MULTISPECIES: GrpB family protein [unclassified Methylobacterium]|uniref:GrpB family protein n=1 Tax=unclassified Methylobacterium TaxID=2615210 RepID=UPI00370025C2
MRPSGVSRGVLHRTELFVLAHDPEAARQAATALFQSVRAQLAAILPASAEVLHIGATAIPGCLTKGDLDIVVRVDPSHFTTVNGRLAASFDRNAGSIHTDDFAAFEDQDLHPHLGLQLTAKGGAFDIFHLFAQALRADRDLVERYNALKLRHHTRSMALYRAQKDAFVAEVLRSVE